jgi:hypothetical protein
MSYQVVELLQLIFALALMFGAFLGGLAVGWWRWGRVVANRSSAPDPVPAAGLFSAHERTTDHREPSDPTSGVPTFAVTREIGAGGEPG